MMKSVEQLECIVPATRQAAGIQRRTVRTGLRQHEVGALSRRRQPMPPHRRGNTIVLVTGILVLLVIIATAYISRTQAGRYTATSYTRTGQRDDVQRTVADDLANEIATALFVHPVVSDSGGLGLGMVVESNAQRASPASDAVRYGVDINTHDPTHSSYYYYNFAPYNVVPWTNWPDWQIIATPTDPAAVKFWPYGPGNPNGGGDSPFTTAALASEFNPIGNPGFGDCRWLRDLEPLRADSNNDFLLDAFSHWRHLTNIARADNGWRIAWDISDLESVRGGDANYPSPRAPSLVTDLNIPVEQWLTMRPGYDPNNPNVNFRYGPYGDAIYPSNPGAFVDQWSVWFGGAASDSPTRLANHASLLLNPANVPHNFYRLSDLDADGVYDEPGERPSDEFVGPGMTDSNGVYWPNGTPRWNVSRILCDTDGDGYTDSFWFLAPTTVSSGIRTIVAVSIIDNGGMLNANVATRFFRNDTDFVGVSQRRTVGYGPVDLALVGQRSDGVAGGDNSRGNFNVGMYDNWDHWFNAAGGLQVRYGFNAWDRHVAEVGILKSTGLAIEPNPDAATRLDFWRKAASDPLSASVTARYTPFSLADELELRLFHGNNYPWIASRYETSTEGNVGPTTYYLLHSSTGREESNEFLDQLKNRELFLDLRHRLTLYNATRNDLMPQWLWRFDPLAQWADIDGNGAANDPFDQQLFQAGMRKFDLRLGPNATVLGPFGAAGNPGFASLARTTNPLDAASLTYNASLGLALRDHLEHCLIDRQPNLNPANVQSYYGKGVPDTTRTESLASAYAANIVQWRDGDWVSPLAETVPDRNSTSSRFMGMEPQPFIVEAFIGHVYKGVTVPPTDWEGDPYTNAGNLVILEPSASAPNANARRSTIVVVQIANPFNVPIDLADYQIKVFGQPLNLVDAQVRNDQTGTTTPASTILEPATDEKPTTAIYYSIDPSLIGNDINDTKWRNFLDIDPADHPNTTIIAMPPGNQWSKDRTHYDSSSADAIELLRRDPIQTTVWVTVDRIDPPNDRRFGDQVNNMASNKPEPEPALGMGQGPDDDVDPLGAPYPLAQGFDIGPATVADQWVDWVRVTRAWGVDLNGNGRYDPNERNPRFVFSDRVVVTPAGTPVTDPNVAGLTFMHGGNRYKFVNNPDAEVGSTPPRPWFTRAYRRADNVMVPDQPQPAPAPDPRKPTFFDMNHAQDPMNLATPDFYFPYKSSYPDKGWYSQRDGVNPPSVSDPVVDVANNSLVRLRFPLQMLQKNGDFEQIGELLNVWLYGHNLNATDSGAGVVYSGTNVTFSEYLSDASLVGEDARINRLRVEPAKVGAQILGGVVGGGAANNLADPRHSIPPMPAGARVFDAFVCDGPGVNPANTFANPLPAPATFLNAKGFDGSGTPGLINLNTAPPEVMQSLPHWYRLVHETGKRRTPNDFSLNDSGTVLLNFMAQPLVTDGSDPNALLTRSMIPEAVLQFREGFNGGFNYNPDPINPQVFSLNPTGIPYGSNYERRDLMFTTVDSSQTMRGERGFASIGETMLLNRLGQGPRQAAGDSLGFVDRLNSTAQLDRIYNQYWRIDLGVTPTYKLVNDLTDPTRAKPNWGIYPNSTEPFQASIQLSTNRTSVFDASNRVLEHEAYDPFNSNLATNLVVKRPHTTAGDVEEANALFAGASNMITTRSDTFTVYFRIRSFRQNTSVSPPVWDATNKEYIVDDSRYVMLVDRSSVNKPGDKPRILYMEKLPN